MSNTTYVLENNILGTKKETFEDLLAVALKKYKEQEKEIKLADIEHNKLLKKQEEETRKKLLEKYKNNEIFGLLHLKVPLNENGDPVLPLNTCAKLKMYLDEILPEGVFSSVLPFEMSYFNFKELFK